MYMYDISTVLNSWPSRKIVRDPLLLPSERVCTVAPGALSTILSQRLESHVLVSPSLVFFFVVVVVDFTQLSNFM